MAGQLKHSPKEQGEKIPMLDFLLTGTNPSGKRDTHRVNAANSQEAYRQFESQGFTEIVLHTDDAAASASITVLEDGTITPREAVNLRGKSHFKVTWFLLNKLLWKHWWKFGLFLAVLCLIVPNEKRITVIVLGVVVAVCNYAFLLFKSLLFPQSELTGRYNELIDSFYWAKWDNVLNGADALRGKVEDFELDSYKAGALAGLGRLEEGLAILKHWEDSDDVPQWLLLTRLSNFYNAACMPDEALKCLAQAYEAEPENPTGIINYSIALSRAGQQTQLAGQLIQSAERMHLSESVAMLLPMAKGLWLTNTGSADLAVHEFVRFRETMQPLAKSNPLLSLLVDLNQAHLAVALLQLGDRERAAREAKPALPRLRALKRTRLLEKLTDVAD